MRSKLGVIFLLYSLIPYSQESEIKVYHWEELPISYNADSIIGLSFSKMKLTSFKVDLAQVRNLKVLDLSKNNNRIKVLDAQKSINDLHQEIITITNQYI